MIAVPVRPKQSHTMLAVETRKIVFVPAQRFPHGLFNHHHNRIRQSNIRPRRSIKLADIIIDTVDSFIEQMAAALAKRRWYVTMFLASLLLMLMMPLSRSNQQYELVVKDFSTRFPTVYPYT